MARILTWDLVISNVVTGCQGFRNPWASEAWVKDANSWGLSHPLPASQALPAASISGRVQTWPAGTHNWFG